MQLSVKVHQISLPTTKSKITSPSSKKGEATSSSGTMEEERVEEIIF